MNKFARGFSKQEARYCLLNKDKEVLEFSRIWIGAGSVLSVDIDTIASLPPGFKDLDSFIKSRTLIKNRHTIESFLKTLGLTNEFDLVLANYGISQQPNTSC